MKAFARFLGVFSLTAFCVACGGGGSGGAAPSPSPLPPASLSTGPEACTNGSAGDFPCSGISLRGRVPLATMGGTQGSDIWGWFDAQTGKEYALMGLTNGVAFVDVTDPEDPVFLGRLPTQTIEGHWRDIKVYQDHAYIVGEGSFMDAPTIGAHGMQVFDLTRLRGLSEPQTFSADVVYGDFTRTRNLAINEESGFAYAIGTPASCAKGLHIIDIRTPNNPMFAGCHSIPAPHNSQCVTYIGPDAQHLNREICVSSNGDTQFWGPAGDGDNDHIEVVDVTDKPAPFTISSTQYPQSGFANQGWLTEDHRFFLLADLEDEPKFGVPTRIHVFDVSDLDAPVYVFAYEAATSTLDHDLYVLGNRIFQANWDAGLRVLEFGDLANRELMEIAFFDTIPEDVGENVNTGPCCDPFAGAWGVYPYLPSGTIIVSDLNNGLFILSMQ